MYILRHALSDTEIPMKLGIPPHTVRSHLRVIFEITGIHKRTDLALISIYLLADKYLFCAIAAWLCWGVGFIMRCYMAITASKASSGQRKRGG